MATDASHEGVLTPQELHPWPGQRIKEFRESLNWTQQELAVALGVHLATVGRWERGLGEPSRLAAQKLQKLYARTQRVAHEAQPEG